MGVKIYVETLIETEIKEELYFSFFILSRLNYTYHCKVESLYFFLYQFVFLFLMLFYYLVHLMQLSVTLDLTYAICFTSRWKVTSIQFSHPRIPQKHIHYITKSLKLTPIGEKIVVIDETGVQQELLGSCVCAPISRAQGCVSTG